MLSKDASNALLKTLEEPPPHVIFVMATTESHKVLPTILSRCQHFDFHRLSRTDVVSQLSKICSVENIKIEPQSLQLIARSTTGSLRDAENLLEQLSTYYGAEINFVQVQAMLGMTGDSRAKEIARHIVNNDISGGMSTLNSVNNDGIDLRQFNRELVEYLRNLLLIKTGAAEAVDLTAEDITDLKGLAGKASMPQILNAVKLFGQIELGNSDSSTLPLELALVDCYLSQHNHSEVKTPVKAENTVPLAAKAAPVKFSPPPVKPAASKPEAARPSASTASTAAAKPETPHKTDAAKPTPEASGESPATSPVLSSEIERLRINWKQILEEVPAGLKKTNAVALLRSAGIKPVSMENETVVLSLKYSIHKDNLEKPEYQQVAEKIISDFLGHPCKIRCVCEPENNHMVRSALKLGAQVTSVEEK
jgi:DNA polymerase III subunit gamma/tau